MSVENIEQLRAGDVIELATITELGAFENLVAEIVDPTMNESMREAWLHRPPTKDSLRPPKFNGTMADIHLVVMDEPYERLHDALERGWSFPLRSSRPTTRTQSERVANSFRGFVFTAEAKSTGRGKIGQVQAELYYGLCPLNTKNGKKTVAAGGASVRTFVTKPKLESVSFLQLHDSARRIGFSLLQSGMISPLSAPIKN